MSGCREQGDGDVQLERVPLAGRFVRLEPYDESIREAVRRALDCDAPGWAGPICDSVLYSITDLDWDAVRIKLEARLSALSD